MSWSIHDLSEVRLSMPRSQVNDSSAFGRHAPGATLKSVLSWTRAAGHNWLARRKAYVLRGLAVRALRGAPVDVEAMGVNMRLYPHNNICEKRILFTPQYFDEDERELIVSRLTPDFTFIDIGANVGGYALFVAANAGPRARVLAVEPQPDIYERLIYNIRQNPFATVKAIDCAIADEDGEITLFLPAHNRGETSMRLVHLESVGARLRVPARTLLNVVESEGFERLDAVKIDVEGAEDLVLEPFLRDAPESLWPKLVVIGHTHGRWSESLVSALAQSGYREILKARTNSVYERF
jgi:FkbM family methyltransferase